MKTLVALVLASALVFPDLGMARGACQALFGFSHPKREDIPLPSYEDPASVRSFLEEKAGIATPSEEETRRVGSFGELSQRPEDVGRVLIRFEGERSQFQKYLDLAIAVLDLAKTRPRDAIGRWAALLKIDKDHPGLKKAEGWELHYDPSPRVNRIRVDQGKKQVVLQGGLGLEPLPLLLVKILTYIEAVEVLSAHGELITKFLKLTGENPLIRSSEVPKEACEACGVEVGFIFSTPGLAKPRVHSDKVVRDSYSKELSDWVTFLIEKEAMLAQVQAYSNLDHALFKSGAFDVLSGSERPEDAILLGLNAQSRFGLKRSMIDLFTGRGLEDFADVPNFASVAEMQRSPVYPSDFLREWQTQQQVVSGIPPLFVHAERRALHGDRAEEALPTDLLQVNAVLRYLRDSRWMRDPWGTTEVLVDRIGRPTPGTRYFYAVDVLGNIDYGLRILRKSDAETGRQELVNIARQILRNLEPAGVLPSSSTQEASNVGVIRALAREMARSSTPGASKFFFDALRRSPAYLEAFLSSTPLEDYGPLIRAAMDAPRESRPQPEQVYSFLSELHRQNQAWADANFEGQGEKYRRYANEIEVLGREYFTRVADMESLTDWPPQ